MPFRLVTGLSLVACTLASSAATNPLAAELRLCREIVSNTDRLACYDALAPSIEFEMSGKGSAVTDLFEVHEPKLLRFFSEDAIMIAYLLDDTGQVVQNLHRGGAGEGRHHIERPGTYRVQVNATGGWWLRLEHPQN